MRNRETSAVESLFNLQPGDRVVTPRDEVGFIDKVNEEGFALGKYAGPLSAEGAQFTLCARLLVRWKPEAPRPKPYRASGVKR